MMIRRMMRRTLEWLLTPFYLVLLCCTVVSFHPLLVLSRQLGPKAFLTCIAWGHAALLDGLKLIGTRIAVQGHLPDVPNRPLIVVSNHQSLFDIPMLGWLFRERAPRFIAKQELGKGIPSISYSLRNMGSALIDRGNPTAAVQKIEASAALAEAGGYAVVIFPEGTRARNGRLKSFKGAGLLALLRRMPSALVVPVAISGSWRITKSNLFPITWGTLVEVQVLPPLETGGADIDDLPGLAEEAIRQALGIEAHTSQRTEAGPS